MAVVTLSHSVAAAWEIFVVTMVMHPRSAVAQLMQSRKHGPPWTHSCVCANVRLPMGRSANDSKADNILQSHFCGVSESSGRQILVPRFSAVLTWLTFFRTSYTRGFFHPILLSSHSPVTGVRSHCQLEPSPPSLALLF